MRDLLALQTKLVPDLIPLMKRRYQILQHILFTQPIGRRSLAQQLRTTERILRSEVEFLREQNLIDIDSAGMRITPEGFKVVSDLDSVIRVLDGMTDLEEQLSAFLKIPTVIVVPGNEQEDVLVKRELGFVAAKYIQSHLQGDEVIAVTGGTTIATVAEMMPQCQMPNVEVIPARGGLGARVEALSNTIASKMADRLGGRHTLLHVPDNLSEDAYQSLLRDPSVAKTLKKVRAAHMVVHGIGQAIPMAHRRNLSADVIEFLRERQAVAETFGYFFNSRGEIVYKMNSLGIHMEDITESKTLIAVAGGADKAEAVLAVARALRQNVLITDQACAEGIAARISTEMGGI